MELQKIYCIDPETIMAGQKDIIQTMYIKKEKSKNYVVCEKADGTGRRLLIKKSKMKYNRARFILSFSLALLTVEELAEHFEKVLKNMDDYIVKMATQKE